MTDILAVPGDEVVKAKNLVTALNDAITQV
jgi:hypothetical protein